MRAFDLKGQLYVVGSGFSEAGHGDDCGHSSAGVKMRQVSKGESGSLVDPTFLLG
jgi:hypothetical protein